MSSETFISNFHELKQKLRVPLPNDEIVFQCEQCHGNIAFNYEGVIEFDEMMDKELSSYMDHMILATIEAHKTQNAKCAPSNVRIHPVLGAPRNLIFSFPQSETKFIDHFTIGNDIYIADVIVATEDNKAVFVLYKQENDMDNTYSEFIKCNYNNFLNNVFPIEELIYDDESFNENQHVLPRMVGGGRRHGAEFNYVCLWCPQEDINKGKMGKFKELKNYRDHFRKKHHREDGKGLPMSEFLDKVHRCEPTWFCTNCKQHQSIGNAVRHKAICKPEQDSESSESDDEEIQIEDHVTIPRRGLKDNSKKRNSPLPFLHSGSVQDINTGSSSVRMIGQNDNEVNDQDNELSEIPIIMKITKLKSGTYEVDLDGQKKETEKQSSKKRKEKTTDKAAAKMVRFDEQNVENPTIIDAENILDSNSEESDEDEQIDIKKENDVEKHDILESSRREINKWWQNVSRQTYSNRGLGGPTIFLPSDSEEFVKQVSERLKKHLSNKKELDNKIIEIEEGDAKLLQFSEQRDRIILDKYTTFVHKFSAKEALNIFAEDYELLDIPTGLKSTTAKQYTNRILEFFKFMANVYHNFHLDWMLDFEGSIEKKYPDGKVNNDIFLPTKTDLLDFVKQFKYGSNPAANCGLRIFAIKKLMDFLSQEIKDNEHVFSGNIIDKAKTVECLVLKIRNLNEGICPDGTIKHLSTASNKSHKRTLMEQLSRCPERSMDSIMRGVQDYVNSDEYSNQKTTLIELACKTTRIPTVNEYSNSTNWLLEQLICIGGNRPCALLGITLRDWEEKQPGYCPFYQDDENEMEEEEPGCDNRKVLKNPYIKPKGSASIFI